MGESAFAIAKDDYPSAVAEARQISHDTIIRNTGRARLSGVEWRHFPSSSAVADIAALGLDVMPEVRLLCDLFPSGVLVMATVEIDPDLAPPQSRSALGVENRNTK